jgi:pseudaminic acid synthase
MYLAASSTEVIAEISGNHGGSLQRALDLVEMVAASGCKIVKFQTYTPDSITVTMGQAQHFVAADHSLWGGQSLADLYAIAHTPRDWHEELFTHARELGLSPFSTPFDEAAVDFLEQFAPWAYKIASLEIVDLPLIRYVASTGRPLIMSTGASRIGEIAAAVEAARGAGCADLTLMLCTSAYPADPADANLLRLPHLVNIFGVPVGLSDHTRGLGASIAAAALGARYIERHVAFAEDEGVVDGAFSLDANNLQLLVESVAEATAALGSPSVWLTGPERDTLQYRPSLYTAVDVVKGQRVNQETAVTLRPNKGLPPASLESAGSWVFTQALPAGTPIQWSHVVAEADE